MKKLEISLPLNTPKQVKKKIEKQLIGKTGFRCSISQPIPRAVRNYYDALLLNTHRADPWQLRNG